MIDPKLNDIPVSKTSKDEPAATNAKPRPGLSVNDTVAANANLSSGGRGVDTSGVRTGTGAGGGSSYLTPGASGSPAPQVKSGQGATQTTTIPSLADLDQDELSSHAYRCWQERGCPEGSPEVDWERAQQELRERRNLKSSAASV
jgi:hypothetical protein